MSGNLATELWRKVRNYESATFVTAEVHLLF